MARKQKFTPADLASFLELSERTIRDRLRFYFRRNESEKYKSWILDLEEVAIFLKLMEKK